MKILQICSKPPLPTLDGGTLAMNNITEMLFMKNLNVKIFTITTNKHPFRSESLPKEYIQKTAIEYSYIDTSPKLIDAFFNLFSTKSYNITRFYSTEFSKKIENHLINNQYNIIHLESIYVAPYLKTIRKNTNAPVLIRTHNIEYQIWESTTLNTKNFFKQFYLKILTNRLKKYELTVLNETDGIISISSNDTNQFRQLGITKPILNLPFSIDLSAYKKQTSNASNRLKLFFIGAMDWQPNLEGINWLLTTVLPELTKQNPKIEFHLAGKSMPQRFKQMNMKNVLCHGEVENAINFMTQNDIMLVPLFTGSGIRIKILEAMALGIPVITTSIGAKGLKIESGKELLIADSSTQFIEAVNSLATDVTLRQKISKNAIKYVENEHDIVKMADELKTFYVERMIQKNNNNDHS